MQYISLVLIILSCILIVFQDFKSRLIHIGSIVILSVALVLLNLFRYKTLLFCFGVNLVFLFFLFATLYFYFRLRKGERKLVDRYIGLGDIVLLFSFGLAYNLYNFTVFIIGGCLLSLIYVGLVTGILRKRMIRIPLAGCLAITHLLCMLINYKYSYDPLVDRYLNP